MAQTITMTRVVNGVPGLALFKPPRRNAVRVRVLRNGQWVDITNRVRRGTITDNNDQAIMTLDLELLNGAGFPSLAPRRTDSELNIVGGEFDPLLWPGRQIFIEAASSTDGSTPDQWHPAFHGVLGDDIDSVAMPNTVSVFCRDQAKWLLDDHIVGPVTYRDMYASQIIAQILADRYDANGIPVEIPFRAIGEDDHWVDEYTIENQTAWQAIQNLVDESGWDCRFKVDESDGVFKLTYWLPSTDMSEAQWIITGSDIRTETLKISDVQLRNRVEVAYRDAQGRKQEVVATNNVIPIRLCRIEEGDTSTIRDATSAQRFADRVLEYLQDLHATDELTVPFNPYISLFDVIEAHNDRIRSGPERYAVDSRTLDFSADSWQLSLTASGSVGVRPQRWIDKETRPGVKRPWEPGDSTTNRPMPTPTGVQAKGIPGGLSISFDEPDPKRWAETWAYVSTTSPVDLGTAPAVRGRSIPLQVPDLTPGQPYYARLIHVDGYGNPSPPGPEVTAIPTAIGEEPDLTEPQPPTGLTAIPVVGGFVLTWDRHEAPPPLDRYLLQRASSEDGYTSWTTVNDEIRSAYYSDLGLNSNTQYQYRLAVISRAQIASDPSDATAPALPGKLSLASQVTDRLARGDLPEDILSDIDGIADIQTDLEDLTGEVSAVVQTAGELSQTVAQVDEGLTTAQTTIQQHATAISQRVTGKDENGNPIGGEIRLQMVDGKTIFLVNADQTIVGNLKVTGPGGLVIESEDGLTKLTGTGMTVSDASSVERVAHGNIGGKPYGDGTLPPNTYGFWGDASGVYLQGYPRLLTKGVATGQLSVPNGSQGDVKTIPIDWPIFSSRLEDIGSHHVFLGRQLVAFTNGGRMILPNEPTVLTKHVYLTLKARNASTGVWEFDPSGDAVYDQYRLEGSVTAYYIQNQAYTLDTQRSIELLLFDVPFNPERVIA